MRISSTNFPEASAPIKTSRATRRTRERESGCFVPAGRGVRGGLFVISLFFRRRFYLRAKIVSGLERPPSQVSSRAQGRLPLALELEGLERALPTAHREAVLSDLLDRAFLRHALRPFSDRLRPQENSPFRRLSRRVEKAESARPGIQTPHEVRQRFRGASPVDVAHFFFELGREGGQSLVLRGLRE